MSGLLIRRSTLTGFSPGLKLPRHQWVHTGTVSQQAGKIAPSVFIEEPKVQMWTWQSGFSLALSVLCAIYHNPKTCNLIEKVAYFFNDFILMCVCLLLSKLLCCMSLKLVNQLCILGCFRDAFHSVSSTIISKMSEMPKNLFFFSFYSGITCSICKINPYRKRNRRAMLTS